MALLSRDDLIQLHFGDRWVMRPFRDGPEDLSDFGYYLHLGGTRASTYGDRAETEEGRLILGPRATAYVRSEELFNMPWDLFAILGPNMDMIRAGLDLLHGPAIEPGFTGHLEFTVVNMTEREVSIAMGLPIAKAMFFGRAGDVFLPAAVQDRIDWESNDEGDAL